MSQKARILPGQRIDLARPVGIGFIVVAMMPLVILPLASIFIYGFAKGPVHFWQALVAPAAIFSLKLSLITSTVATVCNVLFGLIAAYVMAKYNFKGESALTIIISLPTAIPTAVAGFALLLLWGRSGLLGQLLEKTDYQIMFSRFVLLPSLRGAIITGALLTFARSIGEFGSTIMVSGNLALKTQTAPLYIFAKFNEGDVEGANAIAAVLALISFAIFSLILFTRKRLEK
ncbi:MAG: hypothetical protein IPG76_05660 [Acidobacteria bacterium]|nr:hypothetical protein [Acidobacteriota bacterium]